MSMARTMRAAAVVAVLVTALPAVSFGGWMPRQAREEEARVGPGPLTKLGRGLANVATAPFELIRTPQVMAREQGWGRAIGVGVPYGLWRTVLRAVVGAFEVTTFYAEVPDKYGPLMRPEFVFEESRVRRQ